MIGESPIRDEVVGYDASLSLSLDGLSKRVVAVLMDSGHCSSLSTRLNIYLSRNRASFSHVRAR